jgi:hypothetical protein
MIDVHFAIDYFDGTLCQLWDEAAIEAHLDELVTLDDPIEGAVVIGQAEILDALFSAVLTRTRRRNWTGSASPRSLWMSPGRAS